MQIRIGISGVQERIGCTHVCIMLANYLRDRGYDVALIEMNQSGTFENIRKSESLHLSVSACYRHRCIDYYPYRSKKILKTVSGKEYQFVIIDFGSFQASHKPAFCNCDVSIFVSGTKTWELNKLNEIFQEIDEASLANYYFYFNFSFYNEQIKKEIRHGLDIIRDNLFFLPYVDDPFMQGCFPGAKKIIADAIYKRSLCLHNKRIKEHLKKPAEPINILQEPMMKEPLHLKEQDVHVTNDTEKMEISVPETDSGQMEEVVTEEPEVQHMTDMDASACDTDIVIKGYDKLETTDAGLYGRDDNLKENIPVPEIPKTWLDIILPNLSHDFGDLKYTENFIYNRHIMKLKSVDGIEKTFKFMVYPLEYQNNRIPISVLVICEYLNNMVFAYSEHTKIVELKAADVEFIISAKWNEGSFLSTVSPVSEIMEGSLLSDMVRCFTSEV